MDNSQSRIVDRRNGPIMFVKINPFARLVAFPQTVDGQVTKIANVETFKYAARDRAMETIQGVRIVVTHRPFLPQPNVPKAKPNQIVINCKTANGEGCMDFAVVKQDASGKRSSSVRGTCPKPNITATDPTLPC